ncbi:MAG: FkbM family methyltransferase [Fluviicola sp.]
MKKLLTNKLAEKVLIGIILIFRAHKKVFKIVPTHLDYPQGSIRKANRKGINYELDVSDYQEWLIYFHCKSDSSDHVLDYLEKSEIIFDIGANIGQTAFNMFQKQTKKGLKPIVYAFEPFPGTFEKFRTNLSLNPEITEIHALNLGLSHQKGVLHMGNQGANSGAFRITTDTQNSVSVPVTSLDEFVTAHQIPRIDFIKIDVEGYELHVLEGAMKSIGKFKPILIFEYSVENMAAQGKKVDETLDNLLKLNYQISTKEGLTDLKTILQLDFQTDLVCISKITQPG